MMYLPATGLETDAASIAGQKPELRASWLPMIVIAMAQILMSFNINALRVSVGGIVASFNSSPTTVGTAIVIPSSRRSWFHVFSTGLALASSHAPPS